jgi:hypothetical protein
LNSIEYHLWNRLLELARSDLFFWPDRDARRLRLCCQLLVVLGQ